MHPSHIAANGVEQQSVIPPPTTQQLYSPHALGSCRACCLGYFCHLHFTFSSYSHQPLQSTSLWKKKKKKNTRAGVVIYFIFCNVQSSMKIQHLGKLFTQLLYLKLLSSCISFFPPPQHTSSSSSVYPVRFLHAVNISITC